MIPKIYKTARNEQVNKPTDNNINGLTNDDMFDRHKVNGLWPKSIVVSSSYDFLAYLKYMQQTESLTQDTVNAIAGYYRNQNKYTGWILRIITIHSGMFWVSGSAAPATCGKFRSSKIFGWISRYGGFHRFRNSCSAHGLFTAESNETNLGLSYYEWVDGSTHSHLQQTELMKLHYSIKSWFYTCLLMYI